MDIHKETIAAYDMIELLINENRTLRNLCIDLQDKNKRLGAKNLKALQAEERAKNETQEENSEGSNGDADGNPEG